MMKKVEILRELEKLNNVLNMSDEELSEYMNLVISDGYAFKIGYVKANIKRILCENGILPL